MNITKGILLHPDNRKLAFCGARGRIQIFRRMVEELSRRDKRILITSLPSRQLPIQGEIVMGRQIPILVNQIARVFQEKRVIFTGSQLVDGQLDGFSPEELLELIELMPGDYLFIDCGDSMPFLMEYLTASAMPLWEQLIYYMNIEAMNGWNGQKNSGGLPPGLSLEAPKDGNVITSTETMLLFGDSSIIRNENRARTIARELIRNGIENVALANLDGNRIEKVRIA